MPPYSTPVGVTSACRMPASSVESAAPFSRLVGRIQVEALLNCRVAVTRGLHGHVGRALPFDRVVYLLMVLRESAAFRGTCTGVAAAGERPSGISINAIAASLGQPFETARRHVNALIDDGVARRGPGGVEVRPEALARGPLAAMLVDLHDTMIRLVEDLRTFGVPVPPPRGGVPYCREATIAAALDLMLAAHEYLVQGYRSGLEMVVVNAVVAASVRHITFDRILALRYAAADTPPPDQLRRSVAPRPIARGLLIPYTTVRRQVERSVARGMLVMRDGGVRGAPAFLDQSSLMAGGAVSAAIVSRVARAFERLGPGGFPFDDPASRYIGSRPALIAFA